MLFFGSPCGRLARLNVRSLDGRIVIHEDQSGKQSNTKHHEIQRATCYIVPIAQRTIVEIESSHVAIVLLITGYDKLMLECGV